MIENLKIKNFKSIKELEIDCGRVNIFIGEPNTGKSNILESLGILALPYTNNLRDFVRFEAMSNLFYDNKLGDRIKIINKYGDFLNTFEMHFVNGNFMGNFSGKKPFWNFTLDYEGKGSLSNVYDFRPVKSYLFKHLINYGKIETDYLRPPYGENLLAILMTNEKLYNEVSDIFKSYGFRILFRQHESKIEIAKEEGSKLITYPYSLVADTLQRMVFFLAAIETNNNTSLIFEEPESFAFPYYTKQLAERIGAYNINQFFISTHNPYFLMSIIEKTPLTELRVYITYYENYQTKVKCLNEQELNEILQKDIDLFFNLNKYIKH